MSKTKKRILIIVPCAIAALAALFCLWWFVLRAPSGGETVSVEKVSVITGMGAGLSSRFAGMIEPQDTIEYHLDASRSLEKAYVEVGQEVNAGDSLFAYSTGDLDLRLDQMRLDIERTENTIDAAEKEIEILTKQRDKATGDQLLELNTQIKSSEAQIKQEEYNLKSKQLEVELLKDQIDSSVVYADIDGVVQSITEPAGDAYMYDYGYGSEAYIVLVAQGDFRVKGVINELNVMDLDFGSRVIIRSRLDEEQTWTGVIDYVDYENPEMGSGDYYYGPMDETLTSSKYPFYVALDESEGLLLGQHVVIEPWSEENADDSIRLLEYYIFFEGEQAYVWAVNQNRDRIEKRRVTLGEYDEASLTYVITEGLSPDDEIAWPQEGIKPGMAVERGGFSPGPDIPLPDTPGFEEPNGESEAPQITDADFPSGDGSSSDIDTLPDGGASSGSDFDYSQFEYPASPTDADTVEIDDEW